MNEQVWWFVARSSGIVAWALVTVSVCWGLLLSTRAAARASQPKSLLDLHRFLGGLSVVFTGIHLLGLVMDSYVHFGWVEILIPEQSEWQPRNVSWGVVAFYLLLAVEITSLFMKKLPRPLWRQVHRMSFGLYVFATIHGLEAGTDTSNSWYQIAMLASINVVAFLVILMILAHRKSAPSSRSRAVAPDTAPAREPTPV